jgi:glycosyltransferase involved in cell wall biosynthesis
MVCREGAMWRRGRAFSPLRAELKRRLLPSDVGCEVFTNAAPLVEASRVAVARFEPRARRLAGLYGSWAMGKRTRAIARTGARVAAGADVIVACTGVAVEAFQAAGSAGALRVLECPSAHPRSLRRMLQEERSLEPAFADFLGPEADPPSAFLEEVDREVSVSDILLVGSRYAAETYVAEGVSPSRIRVVPFGVDTDIFSLAPKLEKETGDARFVVLFVGQLTQRKGISYLLEAFRAFSQRHTDVQLTLLGRPLADLRPILGNAERVAHRPARARADLPAVYQAADVFVLPSLSEGMGLVVLEAMACGLPVICTPNGPGEVVRDGIDGSIVPIRDAAAIDSALEELYSRPELRVSMGRSARNRAQEFAWDKYTDRVLEATMATER